MNESRADEDAELDALFRSALAQRPEPAEDRHLARRIIAMANDKARIRLSVRNNPQLLVGRVISCLAMVAIAIVLVSGMSRLAAIHAINAVYETSTSLSTSTSSSDEVGPILLVGCVALVATLVYLAVRGSIESDELMLPRSYAEYLPARKTTRLDSIEALARSN